MKTDQEKTTLFALGPLLLFELVLLVGPVLAFTPKLMWHDQQRIEQIVLLCLLTAGGLFSWRAELEDMGSRMPSWIKLSWAFGLGLGLLSSARAAFPRYAGLECASFFLLAWGAVLLAGQSRREGAGFDRWATRIVVLVAFFLSAKAMVTYGAALYWGRLDAKGLFSQSFSNPRFFGQAASMLPHPKDQSSRQPPEPPKPQPGQDQPKDQPAEKPPAQPPAAQSKSPPPGQDQQGDPPPGGSCAVKGTPMTPQEAQQLLDAAKNEERPMIFVPRHDDPTRVAS